MKHILSLGAGVQSSTIALLAARGLITPMPDAAIFADTGWEPRAVYEWLDWLEKQLPFPVYRVNNGNIRDDLIDGAHQRAFFTVPFWVRPDRTVWQSSEEGQGRRQCTGDYKIKPIERKSREIAGLKPKQRVSAPVVTQWIGISTDEIDRQKQSSNKWQINRWPLLEMRWSRGHCIDWLSSNIGKVPPKSSCIGCPFHSDDHWLDMKTNAPEEWASAVAMDKLMRDRGALLKNGTKMKQFMHRQLVPLDQVKLQPKQDPRQARLFGMANECQGICGI